MRISFDIPQNIADQLRAELGYSLEQSAKEALVVEAYRRGILSIGTLAELLGMGVIEADRWLADRRVPLNYTLDDLQADRQTLSELLGESRR
jgi:predicted HTH domain antitoxin